MDKFWYVLHSKPNKEQVVYSQLLDDGFEVFFPQVRVTPVNPRASKVRPYFPGYLFVYADLAESGLNHFRWLPGAHGLVSFDDQPAVMPPQLIDLIAQKVDAVDQAGGLTARRFQHGDRVRINAGPMEGVDAIFDKHLRGPDRVQVLLTILSRAPQPVQLYGGHLSKLSTRH